LKIHTAVAVTFLSVGVASTSTVSGQTAIGEPGAPREFSAAAPQGAAPAPDSPDWGTTGLTAYNVSSWGFTPLNGGLWTHFQTGWSRRPSAGNTTACTNVHLPNGALLSNISTYTDDTDVSFDVTHYLLVIDLAAGSSSNAFSFTTSGTPGVERTLRPVVPVLQIDNNQKAYVLCITHDIEGPGNRSAGDTLWYRLQVSPAPALATFGDVPTGHPFFRFVEALAAAGITAGCGSGQYCPDNPVTRGQMAVFLSIALGLHFPN